MALHAHPALAGLEGKVPPLRGQWFQFQPWRCQSLTPLQRIESPWLSHQGVGLIGPAAVGIAGDGVQNGYPIKTAMAGVMAKLLGHAAAERVVGAADQGGSALMA